MVAENSCNSPARAELISVPTPLCQAGFAQRRVAQSPLSAGSLLSTYQRTHAHALRGRPLPLRHPAPQHLPCRPASLPLPLAVQREAQPQSLRQRQSVRQPPGDVDRQGEACCHPPLSATFFQLLQVAVVVAPAHCWNKPPGHESWLTGGGGGAGFRAGLLLGLFGPRLFLLNEEPVVRPGLGPRPSLSG